MLAQERSGHACFKVRGSVWNKDAAVTADDFLQGLFAREFLSIAEMAKQTIEQSTSTRVAIQVGTNVQLSYCNWSHTEAASASGGATSACKVSAHCV